MNERALFDGALWAFAGLGAATFLALLFVPAPYGRHLRGGFGPLTSGRVGWLLMESTAALVPAVIFLLAGAPPGPVPAIFLGLWELHYAYRAFLYPLLRRPAVRMPVLVVAAGMFFNLVNGALNGAWLSRFAPPRDLGWLAGPRFVAGLGLFVVGFAVHLHSDRILARLPARERGVYSIPERGLHRLVAAPNYLGELMEWIGYALLTWSPAAAVFAFWTAANLVPRALANLRWYRRTFPDYPRRRRALLPFLL